MDRQGGLGQGHRGGGGQAEATGEGSAEGEYLAHAAQKHLQSYLHTP